MKRTGQRKIFVDELEDQVVRNTNNIAANTRLLRIILALLIGGLGFLIGREYITIDISLKHQEVKIERVVPDSSRSDNKQAEDFQRR